MINNKQTYRSSKMTKVMTLMMAALVLAMLSCKSGKKEEEATDFADQEQAVAEVDTMSLSIQTFQKQILCNGRLAAIHKAELACPNSGDILQSVNVHNGQRVSAGQLLAVSDTRDKSVELDKARHDELLATQSAILDTAASLLKAGGRLVYSTCTIDPAGMTVGEHGALSVPTRTGMDGFFLCAMQKAQ